MAIHRHVRRQPILFENRPVLRKILWILAVVLPAGISGAEGESRMEDPSPAAKIVFDFGPGAETWPNIDDPVMGGRSRSRMSLANDAAVFEGVVSLENNGGFASVRSVPAEHELQGFDGIALRVLGDGHTYGVRLRTDSRLDGVSYQAKITTEAGRWTEVRLPFESFVPVFRGRQIRGHPSLDPGAIRTFGLIISDQQEGPFRLEIDRIEAYVSPTKPAR